MKFYRKALALSMAGMLMVATVAAQTKVYYVTVKDGEIVTSSPIKEHAQPEDVAKKRGGRVTIFPDIEFQTIEGIGGTFSEIGSEALMTLGKKGQAEVVGALFGAEAAAFSFCRTPIGASDFAKDAYSYADTEGDSELKSFSIARDTKALIPVIKSAQAANPALKLFATPWSPPAWMKANNTMVDGNKNHRRNILKNDAVNSYAQYLAKYVEAYKAEGVNISRVVMQDEVDASSIAPSSFLPPSQMAKLTTAASKTFKEKGLEAQIWAGSFKSNPGLEMLQFASNKKWLATVDGIGMQNTMLQYISDLKDVAPGKPMMCVEGGSAGKGEGDNSVRHANYRFGEIAGYINAGLPNYCYQNMIATETQTGGWDRTKANSLVTISNKKATYTPDYAVMAIFGRFLKPGSVRIASNGRAVNNVVSVKDGDDIYLFVKNDRDSATIIDILDSANGSIKAEVPAKCIAVVAYKAKQ